MIKNYFCKLKLLPFQSNINALVYALFQNGLRHAVICPGSRNAPLVMALNRLEGLNSYSVVDERSAAFMALGMAKQLQQPVVVCCTSGSALVNFYPAVVEAYYSQIPLLILSADRPSESIDKWDGQAIHQFEVFKPHVKASFQTTDKLNTVFEVEMFNVGNAAYNTSLKGVAGPVHINVPMREPLYEDASKKFFYPKLTIKKEIAKIEAVNFPDWPMGLNSKKTLVLNGAGKQNVNQSVWIDKLKLEKNVVVLSDIISGKHKDSTVKNWESVLLNCNDKQKAELSPEILITTGQMVLNKTIKQLLKTHRPIVHWHIAENGYCPDVYNSFPKVIRKSDSEFFKWFSDACPVQNKNYVDSWANYSEKQAPHSKGIDSLPFNEMLAMKLVLEALDKEKLNLHLSNSMVIRLAAYHAESISEHWSVYANRGVSGIDGCTSTAMGMAMLSKQDNVLLTGDLAFFYDSNAFFHHYRPKNFKIVVFNNGGGGIFRNIEGPDQMEELEPFITTPHTYSCEHIANHHQLGYFKADDENTLSEQLKAFKEHKGLAILEIVSNQEINSKIFNTYKKIQI